MSSENQQIGIFVDKNAELRYQCLLISQHLADNVNDVINGAKMLTAYIEGTLSDELTSGSNELLDNRAGTLGLHSPGVSIRAQNKAQDFFKQLKGFTVHEVNVICLTVQELVNSTVIL